MPASSSFPARAPRRLPVARRASLLFALAPWCVLALVPAARAQDPVPTDVPRPGEPASEQQPPSIGGAERVDINFVEADLLGLVKYFARATGKNFVLADIRELENKKITIISNKKVSPAAAYEAFMSALEVHGLSVVQVGSVHKIIPAGDAQRKPGQPGEGGAIRATDQYITQIIQLENVSVKDVREIVDNLASENAKVLAYAPANTLILTDTGHNIRRIYDIVNQLDVAAPKSSLVIYPIAYAEADQIKALIEELYGTAEAAEQQEDPRTARARRIRARRGQEQPDEGVTAGEESNFIGKVIADTRTNSLIIIANDRGHVAVRDLIAKIDVNVDPTTRSQIYVYRLEHAKAEDVSSVLQDLSQGGGQQGQDGVDPRVAAARAQARAREQQGAQAGANTESNDQGATAVFDSGMRIAPDENTNALVIIASKDDYSVIESVIRELDVKRKQVFVDAVVLEMSSTDTFDFNLAYHAPIPGLGAETLGIAAAQFGTNSLGFDASALSGFATGIYGQTVEVPVTGPDGSPTLLSIPSFGIALNALKTNQMVNIVSSPSLLALDNEEAKIVVGRKIPFPQTSGLNNLGQPLLTFQREDVAITLEMTPRINSENFVTLELKVEVQDVEEGANQGNIVQQGGFITSKREIETVVLVGDNETVVLGGLVSTTDSEGETKIPILGDIPLLGALFRNRSRSDRKTNLMVFLTPHIVDDPDDMREIMRVKEAQRAEFMRRFYGKSQDEQYAEIRRLLQYSMNEVDRPSVYRGPASIASTVTVDGQPISAAARDEVRDELERSRSGEPGDGAGRMPSEVELDVVLPPDPPSDDDAPADDEGDGTDASPDTTDTADGEGTP